MMSSNELFYGAAEPVWVVDPLTYGGRRSYDTDKFGYSGRPHSGGYYRGSSVGRPMDYHTADRYTDFDGGYRGSEYYRSSRAYPRDSYSPDPYFSGSPPVYGSYNDTYYDSRPTEYYDYRRPSTIILWVPICCEACSEEVRNSLFELLGVRSVYCDVARERVTVSGTAAPADVLQVVRKLHKRARLWGDEDYY